MTRSRCRGCGAEIIWATNPETGKKVPIDPRPMVYRVSEVGGAIECIPEVAEDGDLFGVNHFTTCPKANDFHKH